MGGGSLTDEVEFRAAIPVEFSIHESFALQLEFAFLRRGDQGYEQKVFFEGLDWDAKLNYVELPISLKWYLDLEKVRFYLIGGPQIGYGLDLTVYYRKDLEFFKENFSLQDLEINRLDFGVNAGAGVEAFIGNGKKIFIDLRYYIGLRDLDQEPDSEIYNFGKALSIGFFLPLKI